MTKATKIVYLCIGQRTYLDGCQTPLLKPSSRPDRKDQLAGLNGFRNKAYMT